MDVPVQTSPKERNMNEFDQAEISRNRAERSNRALRNLSFGAGVLVGTGVLVGVITPAAAVLYAAGLFTMGISAQVNLRKIQSASDQE